MAVMLSKTYSALRAAGAPDDMAQEAAEEVAGLHTRLIRIEVALGIIMAAEIATLIKLFAI